jgi:hypothetical protein
LKIISSYVSLNVGKSGPNFSIRKGVIESLTGSPGFFYNNAAQGGVI